MRELKKHNNLPKLIDSEIAEEVTAKKALDRVDQIIEFVEGLRKRLKEGEDYAKRPGYKTPSLEKPGAEKVLLALNYAPIVTRGEEGQVWQEQYRLKEYNLAMDIINKATQNVVGFGVGYHRAEVDDIKVHEKDAKGRWVENPDGSFKMVIDEGRIAWANNAALKMAYKSALICAALTCGALSGYFTQDMGDVEKPKQSESKETPNKEKEPSQDKKMAIPLQIKIIKDTILISELLDPFEKWLIEKKMDSYSYKTAQNLIDHWTKGECQKREALLAQSKEAFNKYLADKEDELAKEKSTLYAEFIETLENRDGYQSH